MRFVRVDRHVRIVFARVACAVNACICCGLRRVVLSCSRMITRLRITRLSSEGLSPNCLTSRRHLIDLSSLSEICCYVGDRAVLLLLLSSSFID